MNKLDSKSVIGISALLVHAAKIDEIYSDHEKDLIKNFIKSYLENDDENVILKKAEEIENNSNQLLNYTTHSCVIQGHKELERQHLRYIDFF